MVVHRYKRGKVYTTGIKFPEQEKYRATLSDIVTAIMSDPDLDQVEKINAIHALSGMKGAEQTALLNKVYKKAYGSDVNTTTPLAEFIRSIVDRRAKEKKR